ncbi:hypothetical protein COCVIDRAFT_95713, partial [Bipolaris victoriae FI3]
VNSPTTALSLAREKNPISRCSQPHSLPASQPAPPVSWVRPSLSLARVLVRSCLLRRPSLPSPRTTTSLYRVAPSLLVTRSEDASAPLSPGCPRLLPALLLPSHPGASRRTTLD